MLQSTLRITLVALALVPAAPLGVWSWLQYDHSTLSGIRVDGHALPSSQDPEPFVGRLADAWLDVPVTVRAADVLVTATRREMGMTVDVEAAVDRARALGHSGDPIADLRAARDAFQGRVDIPLNSRVDLAALTDFMEGVRVSVDRDPSSGQYDLDARVAVTHTDGARLDVPSAVDVVATALSNGATHHELSVHVIPVAEDQRILAGLSLDQSLGTYETRYRGWGRHGGRAHNVELATQKLHGAIIPAGGSLSFNERVGARTGAAGFRRAKVINAGELVDGMGGGVCQVASTLHAAALRGGLEMVEYRPHSRPSSYIPMGYDATVAWPSIDLRIQNPFDFPVVVDASAVEGTVRVELLGRDRPREVELSRRVLARTSFGERVVEDPALDKGARVVSQEGIRGARVRRTRTIREGERVYSEEEIVRYPSTDRIVRVGTGNAVAANRESAQPTGALAMR